jgi:putative oxidoreductase
MDKIDAAMAFLRVSMGASIAYHGINKAKSIAGTTSWFSSIGMKWAKQQAVIAATTEVLAGVGLIVGFATTLMCTVIIALMTVAIVTVHARVGYFIFLPNGGWEYCASIIAVATSISMIGPGTFSIDNWLNMNQSFDLFALPIGVAGALCHLALCWRTRNNTPTA